MEAPEQDLSLFPPDEALKVRYAFQGGSAENSAPSSLVRSSAVQFCPLHGGIYARREEVKYIIVHSTETGVPQDARHVINSWSSGGRRHPGAQYIVDRDGIIFETVDPKYATVHVNIFKTLPGINNDNSVGIEMCHTGSQNYPPEQRASVIRLVSYLQDHYHVLNDNVITHRYAQQGDHTDPVFFDFDEFLARKDDFHNKALAMRHDLPSTPDGTGAEPESPPAAVYLEVHQSIKDTDHTAAVQPLTQQSFPTAQLGPKSLHTAPVTPLTPDLTVLNPNTPIAVPRSSPNSAPIRGEIEVAPGAASQLQSP